MKIKFEDLKEQDIVTLIAWFVKKKNHDIITIKTQEGYNIEITKKKQHKEENIGTLIVCPPLII